MIVQEGAKIIEQGRVIKSKLGKATVRIARRSECGECKACGMSGKHIDITLNNTLNAEVDDVVRLEFLPQSDRMFAVIAYLIPIVLMAISMGVCKALSSPDYLMLIVGVAFLIVGLGVAFATDKYRSKKYNLNPNMLEIVKSQGIIEETPSDIGSKT